MAGWHLKIPVILIPSIALAAFGSQELQHEEVSYEWARVLERGSGCWVERLESCRTDQWPIAHDPVLGPGGKLWMVGHGLGSAWVWSSSNGRTWERLPSDAGWGERYGMTVTFFAGQLWAMGGTQQTSSEFRNDAWVSRDGQHWEQVLSRAPWSPRRWHAVMVFDGTLWLLGGSDGQDRNDVWSSRDGRTWTQRLESAPWSPRGGHAALVHGGKMWVLGGGGWDRPLNDVWSSPDGVTWQQESARAPWPGRVHFGAEVYDGRMWIVGGAERNDVWSSADGVSWQPSDRPPWGPRTTNATVVFQDAVWLYGGKTGTSETVADEVWRMRRDRG